jgi:antitoxin ParD1/3/4
METKARNISLTPKLAAMIDAKVASGDYGSASEVVRAGLRLLEEQDMLRQAKLDALRHEVQKGLDDLDAGRVHEGEAVFAELRERAKRHQ